ncbi:sulfite exporter TauE/SafE family protein [Paenibacillus aurantius]|uniref:Probable membrane transporter protein n=1 Tax=Paenibacillus aurantius TaxID=2918900 RepID=A0AA96LFP9_9BACL|nr:sulfite exporter TauE/SafE family protein [Paenibacillus aurantius]WNQ12364.1 sulfite exporter TauE/SafE family protein [Paenibacillus aurantius]
MAMTVLLTMLVMGLILGFAGTGGSGFIIALLITVFHVPVHAALGTSVAAMVFTMLSGTVSHLREKNVSLRAGAAVGLFGAAGAYAGTFAARLIPADALVVWTASMLFLSGVLIWVRTKMPASAETNHELPAGSRFWVLAAIAGLITGGLSGMFGIGSTPFIQLALMILFRMPLRLAVGTTMMVILPIAFFGGIGYFQAGYIDAALLVQVVAGTMIGSYIGAKFTGRAPRALLRAAMIGTPIAGGLIMLLR